STILEKCSPEFIEHYNNADLIISKGQGNLEGLINEKDPRIFFLLMVKCDVIAELLEVEKGSFVVYNGGIDIEK
ncbi:MAG: ARMT1-like domain-containing protein, partial [Bacteroidales bacterium]|nr:ARMT1-like domain-containing protein [Bacteroidales bacterium]